MTVNTLVWASLGLAAIPAVLFVLNLFWYRRIRLRGVAGSAAEAVSVLIPARNEERNLHGTLESLLANRDAEFEVVVLDDHSTDRTAEIVNEFARRDSRVRLEHAPELPPGWCGKQHACHVLAQRARNPLLVFLDADVRLVPDAVPRMIHYMARSRAALASGVPRQELGTFSERLLIPLIHFVLLGYLPMMFMRWTRLAGFSAGCGQLFIARADAYRATGGHAGIRASLHDGVKLPRLFRRAGFNTDLFDATDLATCRMYQTNRETWLGLGKNVTEGLAAPGTILPMTMLLAGGQVLPFVLLALLPWFGGLPGMLVCLAAALAYLPRIIGAVRFRQPIGTALLHPLGVFCLLLIQWFALVRSIIGRPSEWKGRAYPAGLSAKPAALGTRVLLLLALVCLHPGSAQADEVTNRVCRSFELRDQFNANHQVAFPRTNVIVLTIADKQGNQQIDGWIAAIKENPAGRVEVLGIAMVGSVPRPFREGIRKKFAAQRAHPVMLDWDGEITARFEPRKGRANIYVLDGSGRIYSHLAGAATLEAVEQLRAAVNEARRATPHSR